jgi:hypothetical protein
VSEAEAVEAEAAPAVGWYRDPVDPTVRRRWWDGGRWTARVRAFDAPAHQMNAISWRPFIVELAAPAVGDRLPDLPVPVPLATPAPRPVPLPVEAPAVQTPPVLVPGPRLSLVARDEDADPLAVAFGTEAHWPEGRTTGPRSLTRRVLVGVIAASLCALGAGVAGAVVDTNTQRPQITRATTYTDAVAGFRLEYPDGWRLETKTPGQFLRFAIGDRDATPTQANTVSILVGTKPEELPTLEAAASSFTTTLRAQLPSISLDRASHTQLLSANGLRLRFTVPGVSAPVVVDQYVGRTTAGRALTLTCAPCTLLDRRVRPGASDRARRTGHDPHRLPSGQAVASRRRGRPPSRRASCSAASS